MGDARAPEVQVRRVVRERLGAEPVRLEPLAGGLGARLFFRVHTGLAEPSTLVARVEAPEDAALRPPGVAPEPPLEPLRSLLERSGLPVPVSHGRDAEAGVDLLEDLGSVSLQHAVAQADSARRHALYREACALVPRLQRVADPGGVPAFGRRLDAALFSYKAQLFLEWSLRDALGRAARASERAVVVQAFAWIAEQTAAAPARLAHRDFQSSNLLLRSVPGAEARLVMIDFQGAFLAPPEYDLACLLRDSYVELAPDELDAHLGEAAAQLPDRPDPELLRRRFDLLTLTRKAKDHARFLQAAARGERRALVHLPATQRALLGAARRVADLEPRVAALAELLQQLGSGASR